MPTYDYACRLCGHRFEHFASMTTPPLVRCPECKRDGLERLIGSGAGILFKGSGFYETDYKRAPPAKDGKSDGKKPEATKPDGAKADAPKSEAPKSDSPKPAPASDSGSKASQTPGKGSAPKDKRPD